MFWFQNERHLSHDPKKQFFVVLFVVVFALVGQVGLMAFDGNELWKLNNKKNVNDNIIQLKGVE